MVTAVVVAGAVLLGSRRMPTRAAAGAVAVGLLMGGLEVGAWTLVIVIATAMTVRVATERHQARNSSKLPELADVIAAALSSRHDLALALARGRHLVSGDDLGPYDRAISALEHGAPSELVLKAWAASEPSREWSIVIAAVVLAEAMSSPRPLRDVAVVLRVRRLRREDVATQVAQAKASATVVTGAPWAVLAVAGFVDRGYITDLLTSEVGRMCVLLAAVLTLVGAAGMRDAIRRSGLA
jgi:Flp pilus assembly protein TadB